jgi:hypothetical protein
MISCPGWGEGVCLTTKCWRKDEALDANTSWMEGAHSDTHLPRNRKAVLAFFLENLA